MNLEIKEILALIAVSALWGITNPFISRGTKTSRKLDPQTPFFLRPFLELHYFVKNWEFSVPFIFNQLASVLFVVLVVNLPLTLTVVCVNSLTFLITAVTGTAIGEAPLTKEIIFGSVLILLGVGLISI